MISGSLPTAPMHGRRTLCILFPVNLAGYDGVFYYAGEGQITNYDGTVLVQGQRNPYEIVTTVEVHPELADQARKEWGLEK
ncbi:MAG: hypothetical protein ACLRIT_08270 [Blautia sp.]